MRPSLFLAVLAVAGLVAGIAAAQPAQPPATPEPQTPSQPVPTPQLPQAQPNAPAAKPADEQSKAELPDAVKQRLPSVVKVSARIAARARSAATLGSEREGHGVVIGEDGLILTIGYLILEAEEVVVSWGEGRRLPASVVAYDYESGFGLVRTAIPLKLAAVPFGDSDAMAFRNEGWVAGSGGEGAVQRVRVVGRRDFAGYWEYLLENAIFTTPPYSSFGGAALFSPDGALVGIGSLQVPDAMREGNGTLPGNMFIPINRLKPIVAELVEKGRVEAKAKPWIGVYIAESLGRVVVAGTADGAPAATAGVRRGDIIAGINGMPVHDAAEFYRTLWAAGEAGVEVRLQVERLTLIREITVTSGDRYKYLRQGSSL
jgi:serine protease Do